MYTQDDVITGLLLYIKKELIPILPDYAKVLGGAVLLRNSSRITQVAQQLTGSQLASTLGIVADDGKIDVDIWGQNIKDSIREFGNGKFPVQLPMLQPIYISESDIDTLKRYIKGELK